MGTRSAFFSAVLLALGCSQAPPPSVEEARAAIVDGEPDRGPERFPGVVAVGNSQFGCSGTLIAVTGTVGWVLTAGHCVVSSDRPVPRYRTIQHISIGVDRGSARQFTPIATYVHPRFQRDHSDSPGTTDAWPATPAFDVALVAFGGADAAVAALVVPPLRPAEDALAAGTSLDLAGFGWTMVPGSGSMIRHRATSSVGRLFTTDRVAAPMLGTDSRGALAGPCNGDSGGPALVTVGAELRVAGVMSAISDSACQEEADFTRVSGVVADFIDPVLAGAPPAASACLPCIHRVTQDGEACYAAANAYAREGNRFGTCLESGRTYRECAASEPAARPAFDAYWGCVEASCPGLCTGGERAFTECHYAPDGFGPCSTCVRAECCDVAAACQRDRDCLRCSASTDYAPSCATNALWLASVSCLRTRCDATCTPRLAWFDPPAATDAGVAADGALSVDAALPPDATAVSPDATAPSPDASLPVTDAGAPRSDASELMTAEEDGGCTCLAPRSRALGPIAGLTLLALGLVGRRRDA